MTQSIKQISQEQMQQGGRADEKSGPVTNIVGSLEAYLYEESDDLPIANLIVSIVEPGRKAARAMDSYLQLLP